MNLRRRFRILSILFGLAAGFAVFVTAPNARAGVFNPETFTLANGMQVVVVPNHRVPVVTHMVWYKVGAADEPAGKTGIAHFLEHLMFKATKYLKSGEFSEIVALNGGHENAFTSSDYTAYYQNVAVDRLETMMKHEAERMTGLLFDKKEVETERQVVLEERRMRIENSPAARLGVQVDAALYLNYPYRHPVIGWEREIRGLTIPDLQRFYHHWYAPNNAILVVAGDITAAQLKPLAEKYYGAIPRGPKITRARPQEPQTDAARRVTLRDARVRQPSWRRVYLAPSLGNGDRAEVYPLEVLAEIFGGGTTSRLYRQLVVEHKLAVNAGANYDGDERGPTKFTIYASPQPGVTMEALEAAVGEQVARLLSGGVTADEVARAKKRMQADAVFARDSLGAGARVLGAALASGETIDDVESWPDRIGAVTVEQVDAAARAVLKEPNSVTGLLLPAETAKAETAEKTQ